MKNKCRLFYKYLIISLMLLVVIICSLIFGGVKLSIIDVISGLFTDNNITLSLIMKNIRLSRIFACILAGCGLSISGLILQNLTHNELASPNIIGVNSGAGLFIVLSLVMFPQLFMFTPFFAFIGALLTTGIIIIISKNTYSSKTSLILAGVAVTTIVNAIISFITLVDNDILSSYNYFSIGGLNGVTFNNLVIPCGLIIISFIIVFIFSRELDILLLGNQLSVSLGVNTKRIHILLLIVASLSAASVVSFAGLLGFVGLIVPHISRKIIGNNTKHLLITSCLIGSIIVILGDLLGRVVLAPTEIPVGIVMALVGSPFFLIVLLRRGKHDKN